VGHEDPIRAIQDLTARVLYLALTLIDHLAGGIEWYAKVTAQDVAASENMFFRQPECMGPQHTSGVQQRVPRRIAYGETPRWDGDGYLRNEARHSPRPK
jgi:hypothetical protein